MNNVFGFFGKVPAHGDFIERGLPQSFINSMDEWLQGAISCSQGALGNDWLSSYLTCPLWRFGFGEGALDEKQWLGVLCPSVDTVGRYFPLVIATQLKHGNIFAAFQKNSAWFDAVENLALSVLENGLPADEIESQLATIPAVEQEDNRPSKIEQYGWLVHGTSAEAYGHLLSASHTQSAVSLWESRGGESQGPTTFVAKSMPPAHYYTLFLTGRWQLHEHTF
ncbi:MAG TPA: type VI secretion system-associated protein TagF [Marinagarivorans sp.]